MAGDFIVSPSICEDLVGVLLTARSDMIRTLNPMAGSNQIPHAPEEPLGPPAAFARSTEPNSPIQEERRTSLFTYGLANEEPIDEVGIEWPEHWDQVPGTL